MGGRNLASHIKMASHPYNSAALPVIRRLRLRPVGVTTTMIYGNDGEEIRECAA